MKNIFPLRFLRINRWQYREQEKYKYLTQEVMRINYQTIYDWDRTCPAFVSFKNNVRNYIPEMKQNVELTYHLKKRLESYIYQKSRHGTYIELLPNEFDYICNIQYWFNNNEKLVQIGWNDTKQICKLGFTHMFPKHISNRVLFLCIGTDGGVNTVYVTPQFKHRYSCNELKLKDVHDYFNEYYCRE